MNTTKSPADAMEMLVVARRIADHAKSQGALTEAGRTRPACNHLGAVLADSVLQAGLNYTTVVRPRIDRILQTYPDHVTVSSLASLIRNRETEKFLNWSHGEKVGRFKALVEFLAWRAVESVTDLRRALEREVFRAEIQTVSGIGPKTADYMACLIGIDSIAVDRHVRSFARSAGIDNDDYDFLRRSFCCAADLLSLRRREFDSWLWHQATVSSPVKRTLRK